jgi:hypothetical protein
MTVSDRWIDRRGPGLLAGYVSRTVEIGQGSAAGAERGGRCLVIAARLIRVDLWL